MVRRPVFSRALALLTGLATLLVPLLALGPVASAGPARAVAATAPGSTAPGRPAPGSPLLVTIDSMTPAHIPARGPIRVTGQVINRDTEAWSAINLHPFIGTAPITSREELAAAAELPADQYVGDRLTDVLEQVESLQPGTSTTFSMTVPREVIDAQVGAPQPGVYWFGVHASGASESRPRDDFADGRARTFLPYVPPTLDRRVKTALVLPLRRRLAHEPDGSLSSPDRWERSLSSGWLRDAVAFGEAAGEVPLTWMVDPALPDAVQRLAVGNPPRDLGPTDGEPVDGATLSPSPSTTEDGQEEPEEPQRPTPTMRAASEWLADLEGALRGQELLTLPYGDLDVAAAADHDRPVIELARAQVGEVLEQWDLDDSPVAGSPSGYVDPATITALDPDVPLLVTDRAFPGAAPGLAEVDGHALVVTSSGAAAGGPGPGDRTGAVPLRQRILSEAALKVLDPAAREPLVVPLPARLPARDAAEFFGGLDAGWVELTTVEDVADRRAVPVPAEDLVYPESQERLELDAETFRAAARLISSGETLQNLLSRNNEVAAAITDQALTALSYSSRQSQSLARAGLELSADWVERRLRGVTISAPPAVTLSSTDGEFVATVSNELDQPVTVGISARTDPGLEVSATEPIELAPRSRTSVLLDARVTESEVQNVTLALTDAEGTPLGSSDRLPIRSAQVSGVIWVIIGSGAAILFGAILVRLYRRFRRRGRADDPAGSGPDPAGSVDGAVPTGSPR